MTNLRLTFLAVATLGIVSGAWAQDGIADKTKGLALRPGLIESYLDAKLGKAYLKLPAPKAGTDLVGEYLYTESLATGLGNNDLGLDRGETGNTWILNLRLISNKVLFEIPNYSYRATSPVPEEQRATREAFATSVVYASPVVARDPDGSLLIDVTDFLVRDAHGVASSLGDPGTYALDRDRSVLNAAMSKAFPDNLEFEALLTFRSARPNRQIGNHAPEPEFVTLAQRHSIVRLPDSGYKPRAFHPRSGSFGITYLDMSSPLGQPLVRKFIARHRLELENGRVKKPIVYYVDRGVPEPIRSALIEGGNYWQKAFEAAGFKDAFRVELMPEGMDLMDVRNHVIHWTHRSTRGWAYGNSVTDPRTGEIVRGVVNLDSQRARQDIMLFESLLGVDGSGTGGINDPIQVALSRIRQLSAHEIGHTLGFVHNFAASVNNRASVLDYPAPLIKITPGGELDFSDAYTQGVGDWDIQLVRYAYTQFAGAAAEAAGLKSIIDESIRRGLLFLTDQDANEVTGSDPRVNRWDNGSDPIAGLQHAMRIRRIGMSRFGERNIRPAQPVANLETVFGPLYYFHRYDVDAVVKMVGGNLYEHRLRGDGQAAPTPVSGDRQRSAVEALIACLQPSFLDVPPSISNLLGPRAYGYPATREDFPTRTAFAFDTVSAASSAADLVLAQLLNPVRAARVSELSVRNPSLPTLEWVLGSLIDSLCVLRGAASPMQREIGWAVQHAFATRLMDLAQAEAPTVRSRATEALRRMLRVESGMVARDSSGHAAEIRDTIQRFLSRPLTETKRPGPPPAALPGQPIGG